MSVSKKQNGGYYAIKGFTYQFDKSLLEILNNQTQDIELEQIQDIGVSNYYIQVKYKETQNYADSKIKPAVLQLLKCFIVDKNKKFKLHSYFKDKSSQVTTLTENQLNQVLGSDSSQYTQDDKKAFIENFICLELFIFPVYITLNIAKAEFSKLSFKVLPYALNLTSAVWGKNLYFIIYSLSHIKSLSFFGSGAISRVAATETSSA